jgi:UDP-N-acetylglucosamine--N-acetylmuramyl-(pentapeptide) pyrophosphoryl-undecaprenol N-acetylglucosamine transferase
MSARPILIVAGGTGGHVFPALAVAQALRDRSVPVVWLGTAAGLEARVVPAAGIRLETLPVKGLRGNGWRGWLQAPFMLLAAVRQALGVIYQTNPVAVLGMGGYVTGPGALAARLSGRALVIHEQNAIPGLTNRLVARIAQRVLTGLDAQLGQAKRREWTGNPIRAEIAALPAPGHRDASRTGPVRLLVIGGSLGARRLNQVVPAALAELPQATRPVVWHQAGERTLETAQSAYQQAGVDADIDAFITDMAAAYAWCDLVVCRAGALTVSELAAAGVPAVFVPLPHAVDDHQTRNAEFLTAVDAARLIPESTLTPATLATTLHDLLGEPSRLTAMARAARAQGRPNAAERVADVCMEVAA